MVNSLAFGWPMWYWAGDVQLAAMRRDVVSLEGTKGGGGKGISEVLATVG